MAIFFTSDTHFRHKKALVLCNRPFRDVDHMDAEMIARWNTVVGKDDVVYHLGDFAWSGDHDPLLAQLNGIKHLIRGNHDHTKQLKKATLWASVEMMRQIKIDGIELTLCHYNMRIWRNSHKGALHLHGHSHGELDKSCWDNQSIDVGVDVHDFVPRSLEYLMGRMATYPPRSHPDYHKPGYTGKVEDAA